MERMVKMGFYNMDCMEGMKQIPDKYFDLCICDPPYGININKNMGRQKGKKKRFSEKDWDTGIPDQAYFDELKRVSVNQIIWGGNYFPLPQTQTWIFWDKQVPKGVSFSDGELAWTSFTGALVKVAIPYFGFQGAEPDRIHPTQKPVALYKWLLKNYAKPGDKILDTHVGSASSLIACHDMGFEYMGFELDKEYFDAATERLEAFKRQPRLEEMIVTESKQREMTLDELVASADRGRIAK